MYTCIDNALFSELLLQVPLHQKSLVLETFGLVGHKASQQASWLIHLAATEKQLDRVSMPSAKRSISNSSLPCKRH